MLIVQKYGGTSVADTTRIFRAAQRIASDYRQGYNMVVVLSAQGNTTDDLLAKAQEISPSPPRRELDALLATGEQQSAALMAMALNELGLPALSLNALQAGIFSTPEHGCAKIIGINPQRINTELEKKNIVIITGFQGVNRCGEVTTLGRGASDTTAIALADVLHADICVIYTDVDGVYTADPRVVADAHKYKEIGYDDLVELSSMGASVMHNRAVELAKKCDVEFYVKSAISTEEATRVWQGRGLEARLVCGIAKDKNVSKITLHRVPPTRIPEILRLLATHGITVDSLTHSVKDLAEHLVFSVPEDDGQRALQLLQEHQSGFGCDEIHMEKGLTKLSVTGTGVAYDPEIMAMFYETLIEEKVTIDLLSLSATKISTLVADAAVSRVIAALHSRFTEAGVFIPQIRS